MNISELDAYNLDDAVKFNDRLNPKIWDASEHLKPEVRDRLLTIAEDFKEFLGLSDLDVKDITISGSNAAYTYTPNSDIDLHIVADVPEDEVYRELFDAKKGQYNDQHNITIGGYDVELYVETAGKPPVSQGMYSVLNNEWIQVPRRVRANVDDVSTQNKFETIGHAIERAVKSGNLKRMDRLAKKIKKMRQTGLEAHGEFGPENLAFKMLRTQGKIKELYDARNSAKDRKLSLKEEPKKPFVYGFKEDAGMSWDGVSPTTNMFLDDAQPDMPSDEEILRDFIKFCVAELKIESMPTVKLRKDPQWSVVHKTFGRYVNDKQLLEVAWGHRHIMDVLRTVAHELTHRHQHERDGERMDATAGETGSPWENEANARAGILMRDYARLHPEYFAVGQAEKLHGDEVTESASGYIPTKAEANDPRYKMALTVDIKPGQVGKEANKLKLRTDKQGHPQIAKANGLFEKLALELNQFKRRGTLAETTQLDEVRMAPSNLKQFAMSPEAEGIQAGFEAELIFRDTTSGDSGGDMEPDYDADERVSSIEGIIEFFQSGDYGYMSDRQTTQLREKLEEQYYEWFDEKRYEDWQDNRDELIRDAHLEETPWDERIHAFLVDGMDFDDRQADAIQGLANQREAGKIKGSDMTEEQLDMITAYSEAREGADDILDEDVEQSIAKEDEIYERAKEEFDDNFSIDDDSGFFSDVGLRWMSDVANEYSLDWPYMTGGGNDGSRDWDSIGDDLHEVVDMPVKVSSGYHSATRKPGLWIVEPDSSLEPDDREDYGLEIVSPPMPLKQALEQLEAVTDWANGPGNAYTNSSTGLHMGVSIPYKEGRVDYLKLILFLGDEYVLQQYGREANTYTKAAMREIKQRAGTEKNATAVLELLRNNLLELAEREVAKSTGEGKYTSAHKKDKYIEFRSAGGDWLAEANADPGKLENTMMRYAYAMYLAGRPDLERREYAKKLYKLVAGGADDSTMALFSQYAAGELDKEQLKKRWAEKTLSKEAPKEVEKGEWVVVDNSTKKPVQGQSYNGYTKAEARARAKQKLSPASSDTDFDLAYSVEPQNTGRWEIYSFDPDSDATETLEVVDADNRGAAVDLVWDKYNDQKIPFKVRPYYGDKQSGPEKQLSPRAKLAKRIVKPKQEPETDTVDNYRGKWEFFYVPTGRVLDAVDDASIMQARAVLADTQRRYDDLPADQIQMRKADAEQEPAVAQNFAQSTNPNPTAPIADQVRMPNGVPVWELYDISFGTPIHVIADHTAREAWSQAQTWLRNHSAEDPPTWTERFGIRPKMLQPGERNLSPTIRENFADGKGPGRPGDSQRHGIPKGATIAQLEKASHAGGRKGQLARWQLNMRRGHNK
jgi:hypothetical protein